MKTQPRIVLASTSPRRIELLATVGLKVDVASPSVDETPKPRETPRALVRRLARAKAESVARKHPDAIVIAADTIVVSPKGKILGKPRDAADARKMLREIQGRSHVVLTGYSVVSAKKSHTRICASRVKVRKLTPAQVDAYIRSGEPSDKAGAYAIQEIGMAFIESVSGNHSNVVGLPIEPLLTDLEKRFGIPLFSWLGG